MLRLSWMAPLIGMLVAGAGSAWAEASSALPPPIVRVPGDSSPPALSPQAVSSEATGVVVRRPVSTATVRDAAARACAVRTVAANPRVYRPESRVGFFCCPRVETPRGPFEIRDEFMVAQPRLTLPAVSPDPLCRGQWLLRIAHDWGNDFGYSQSGGAESPTADRRFFVDGEHRTVEMVARYGLTRTIDVGLRVPLHWRGGGFMDGLIDWWHELGGFQDNGRAAFDTNRYRVQGRDADFNLFAWPDRGGGLGNIELEAHWAFLAPQRRSAWRAAVVGRLGVPTGTGPYETGSVDAGLQVAVGKQLGSRFDVYGGIGGTWYSEDTIEGFVYDQWRGYAFVTLEYRVSPLVSLLVQVDGSSRLITNLVDYPDHQSYLQVGARFQLSPRAQLYAGLTENIQDQQSTVDAGVWGGLEFRL